MFKFRIVHSYSGAYGGYLLKEVDKKDMIIGGFQVDQQNQLHLNIHKGKELSANELILLFSQMTQSDKSIIEKKVYINSIEE